MVNFLKVADMVPLYIDSKMSYCAAPSIVYYRDALALFVMYLDSAAVYDVQQLTPAVLRDYAFYLREERKIKATSIHTYFRAVNAFIRWLIEEGYVEEFRYRVKLPKQNPELVLPLTCDEVQELCAAITAYSQFPLRDLIIFRLMLDCGCRSSEVRHLRYSDIDIKHRILKIRDSKFNKSRLLPVPEVLSTLLQLYISEHPGTAAGFLLESKSGEPLTANSIKQLFGKLKNRSRIRRVHAHLLRHTFATSYMMQHNNIEYLRIYLGHESYQVTQGYVHLASQCLLTRYDVYQIDSCFI